MRILFVSQYFYPEIFRGNDICFELANKGHEVTVLTGIPNYPQGTFFEGYGLFKKKREIINGVSVVRVPIVPRGNANTFRLLLNYFSYPLIASAYTFYWGMLKRFDLVLVQQLSPVMIAIPGILYKKLHKVPLHTWVLDLWPESLMSAGGIRNKYVLNFFNWLAKCEYRNADKIWMSSNAFKQSILSKGDYTTKLVYFPNWAENVFEKGIHEFNLPSNFPNGFIVMFAGNIGEAQDFDHIMEAALQLKQYPQIKFVFVGDGRKKKWLDEYVVRNQLYETVFVLGRYPIESMPSFFNKADVMLVSLKDELVFNLTAPAKLQAYMAASKPIVAMINGEGAKLIQDAKCGLVASAGDSQGLKEAIYKLFCMSKEEMEVMGNNAYLYYKKHFDKETCMQHLHLLLQEKK